MLNKITEEVKEIKENKEKELRELNIYRANIICHKGYDKQKALIAEIQTLNMVLKILEN